VPNAVPIIISIATFISTFLGGRFALRFKDKLHLILGFSAGAVVGVAFFDLIPEAINLGAKLYSISFTCSVVAAGFLGYMILDRWIVMHGHADDHDHEHEKNHVHVHAESTASGRGKLGAGSLVVHSFLDGVAIGLAFQVSVAVGGIVAVAVLVHDFSDGINTVNLVLKNKGGKKEAARWLIIDALAPVIGVISTLFFTLPESALGIILAIFSGFFLYIGASDLLPESHHNHPTVLTTLMTILGAAVLFTAIRFANI
jgi:ZIP family zinc transporter